jgi:hypothetical protein
METFKPKMIIVEIALTTMIYDDHRDKENAAARVDGGSTHTAVLLAADGCRDRRRS